MMSLDTLVTAPSMFLIAIVMALGWSVVLENLKSYISDVLTTKDWWLTNAIGPTKSFMYNFGYPKKPTATFPEGVTEPMARESYAMLNSFIFAHFVLVIPMLPLVYWGWEDASETMKCWFVLGTLSDVGFQLYDAIVTTTRTFFHQQTGTKPLPFNYWFLVVCMHHTLAMSVVIPMNLFYLHLDTYHQTVVSLIFVGGLCYFFGNIKFTLDVKSSPTALLQYKAIVVMQLVIIVHSRLYCWFPSIISLLSHIKSDENGSKIFLVGGCIVSCIFSVFNVILVMDSFKAFLKWMPKKFSYSCPAGTTTAITATAYPSDSTSNSDRGEKKRRPSLRLSLIKKNQELNRRLVTTTMQN